MLEQKLFMQLKIENVQIKATWEGLHVFLWTRLKFKVP